MSAILASFLQTGLKFVLFIGVAWAGIVCGKKYRDKKDAANASAKKESN